MKLTSFLKANRKRIFFLFLSIIVLAVLAWRFYPEYGNSYSEQQRRLWNQYLDTCDPLVIDSAWYKPKPPWRDEPDEEQGVKDKLNSILGQIEQLNLTGAVPATYPPLLPDKLMDGTNGQQDPAKLRQQANSGDGEAALSLFRFNRTSITYDYKKRGDKCGSSWTIPVFRKTADQRKWLILAIKNKRPGAEFLLDILHNKKEKAYERDTESLVEAISENTLKGDAHYQDFLSGIKNGDLALYQYALCANPDFPPDSLFREMKKALLKKAKKGDKTACRQILELMLSKDIIISQSNIFIEFSKPYAWAQKLNLPHWVPGQKNYRSQTLSDFHEALTWCKKAANSGDMEAQYLWLKYALPSLRHIDRSTLNDILDFHRNLIEKGYRPYLKAFYEVLNSQKTSKSSKEKKDSIRKSFSNPYFAISHKIILSLMPADEVRLLSDKIKKLLYPSRKKSAQPSVHDFERQWQEHPDEFARGLPQWLTHKNQEIRQAAEKHIHQSNDLSTILAYSILCQQGKSIPTDKPHALSYIRKALEIVNSLSPYDFLPNSYHYDSFDEAESNIDYVTRVRFIRFNMDTETPGAHPEEAYSLALKMISAEQSGRPFEDKPGFILAQKGAGRDRIFYYLGYMNEHGIGTPRDLEQAVSFYMEGSKAQGYGPPDSYCRVNLSRLYEEGKGTEQSDEKALDYARKATECGWRLTNEQKKEVNARIERLEEKQQSKKSK